MEPETRAPQIGQFLNQEITLKYFAKSGSKENYTTISIPSSTPPAKYTNLNNLSPKIILLPLFRTLLTHSLHTLSTLLSHLINLFDLIYFIRSFLYQAIQITILLLYYKKAYLPEPSQKSNQWVYGNRTTNYKKRYQNYKSARITGPVPTKIPKLPNY